LPSWKRRSQQKLQPIKKRDSRLWKQITSNVLSNVGMWKQSTAGISCRWVIRATFKLTTIFY
jgi:hypothetical protein